MSAQTADTSKLKDTTLLFLVKKQAGKIQRVCLAMKKRGFGKGRWNGVGGKMKPELDKNVEDTARRETVEEIGVIVGQLDKVADLFFYFPENPDWNQHVHAYICEEWSGTPIETEEMAPKWYSMDLIPYPTMWPDDLYWFPEVLKGKYVEASFSFGPGDVILEKQVTVKEN